MQCPNCGLQNPPNSMYCERCRYDISTARVGSTVHEANEVGSRRRWWKVALAGYGYFIGLASVAGGVTNSEPLRQLPMIVLGAPFLPVALLGGGGLAWNLFVILLAAVRQSTCAGTFRRADDTDLSCSQPTPSMYGGG